MTEKDNKLIIYQAKDGALELRGDFGQKTLWVTQKQMAKVFEVNVRTVNEHLKNIFKTEELKEDSVIRKFRITASDGKIYDTNHYNLDVVISVGYRINSKTATKFRQWATGVLKSYVTEGYVLNKKIFIEKKVQAQQVIEDIKKLSAGNTNIGIDDVLELVQSFSETWFSLESYDKEGLPTDGFTKKDIAIQSDELYADIAILKKTLVKKKEATELFAQEKNPKSLEGILGNVFQSVFGKDAYDTVEEKAAYLLYFIIKNHPFNDGNKRTGAFTFIWFLNKARVNFRSSITPEALTSLTLLIAESNPQDKGRMVGLVILLLKQ